VRPEGLVAFARAFLQAFDLPHPNVTALVGDKSGVLEGVGDKCHAATSYSQHLGDEFLGQRYIFAIEEIAAAQQPPRQPRLQSMARVARRRLLRLGEDCLLVPDQNGAEIGALGRSMTKPISGHDGRDAGDLNDRTVHGDRAVDCRNAADEAVATDHRGLDHLPRCQIHQQGDDAAVGEIDAADGVAILEEDRLLREVDGLKMRPDRIEIGGRKRGEQAI